MFLMWLIILIRFIRGIRVIWEKRGVENMRFIGIKNSL